MNGEALFRRFARTCRCYDRSRSYARMLSSRHGGSEGPSSLCAILLAVSTRRCLENRPVRQPGPRSQIALDAAENFLQTPRKCAADRRLAGEEVRNPTLEPLDRTEGMRPHRIQIEQAAELVFPE